MTDAGLRCAIGLDVGGTKIAGGVVDLETGRPFLRRTSPTRPERGGAAVLEDALQLAGQLTAECGARAWPVSGLGVAVCELVDLGGQVTSGYTVQWQGLPVLETFARQGPAMVESDVRAHALAEAEWGAGRGLDHFVFVTVGTGISSCLVIGGRPHAGAHGNALVLATSPVTLPCPQCGNTSWPSLEEYSAGPALAARYNSRAGARVAAAEEVTRAAVAGDALAGDVVRTAAQALGASLAWLVNVLDPQALVIGGGLGLAGGLYWGTLVEAARAHIWAASSRAVPILPAVLGVDAGLAGAALAGARAGRLPASNN